MQAIAIPSKRTGRKKPFVKPSSPRRLLNSANLVLALEDGGDAYNVADASMIAPEMFDTGAGVYLDRIFDQLSAAHSDSDLVEVDYLRWRCASRMAIASERDLRQ